VPALALFAAACSDRSGGPAAGEPGGTLVISTTTDPGTLFPPLIVTTQAKQITEQIYDYLADVGTDLNAYNEKGFRRALADGWRWSADSLSLAFHINPRARWHDGQNVTARDVAFTFALNKNPALGGRVNSELANIDSVTVTDSLTPVFWFREKLPKSFLDAAAQLLILPAHQLEKIPEQPDIQLVVFTDQDQRPSDLAAKLNASGIVFGLGLRLDGGAVVGIAFRPHGLRELGIGKSLQSPLPLAPV